MSRHESTDGRDQGAAALEFALVLSFILIPMLLGLIEFGFAFQAQLAITHAAREGARLASVNKYDAGQVVARAYPLSSGLSISESESGDSVTVSISYPYAPRVFVGLPTMNLGSRATMRKEY